WSLKRPRRAACLLALCLASSLLAQTRNNRTPAPLAPPAPRSRLGVNIGVIREYVPAFMFIDVIKSSRRFGSVERPWEGEVALDEHGWPLADCGVVVFSDQVNVNGVYRFSCTGPATVRVRRSPAAVRHLAYDQTTNRTTCDIVFDAPQDELTRLHLTFTGTTNGVKDIKLFRPGYTDDSAVFTDEFLSSLKPFGALRFMIFLNTNDSTIRKWSERPRPSDAQFSIKGGPYEIAIELGNRLGKDVWLNIPAGADDDFVRQLAKLVKEQLAPGINCYIEWSNELWNRIFSQHQLNLDAAREETINGDRKLSLGGRDTDPRHWGWRRTARRTAEIAQIFRQVCGPDPRIRVVLAGQHVNPAILETGLRYIETNHGPPRDFLYGIAIAPYFGNADKVALKRADSRWTTSAGCSWRRPVSPPTPTPSGPTTSPAVIRSAASPTKAASTWASTMPVSMPKCAPSSIRASANRWKSTCAPGSTTAATSTSTSSTSAGTPGTATGA
ncbi:MAG TPA: hypothetical protein VGR35_18035, partial [Tepidisphaeraceae bacterium]|nr:hypothetical protein [Tepidisphaeraceae bacterium]